GASAPGHGRLRRRRQEHTDRAAAVRLEGHLRGPAGVGGAGQRPARPRVHQPCPPHRRPAGRAGAGNHHRRRLPLLRHAQAEVHHRRHPRPRAVHPQHGHRGVHGRRRGRPRRRPQGSPRAVPSPRVHRHPPAHPPPGRGGEQDGPRRLGRRPLPQHRRRLLRVLRQPARGGRRHLHPALRAPGRQRRGPLRADALVRGAAAARAPRDGPHRRGPQPGRHAVPRPVRHPTHVRRPPRLPRLCRAGGRRRDPGRRPRDGPSLGSALPGGRDRHLRRAHRGSVHRDVGHRAPHRRHRRVAGRHARARRRPALHQPGRRGGRVLDDRPASAPGWAVRHQAHHPLGPSHGGRPPLPARHQHPRARRDGRRPQLERDREGAPTGDRADHARPLRRQPHHRQLHPCRRSHQCHRRCGDDRL
ncbi:MAG: Sulfate adenylyltransferase subunit 1, partial [uncultured Acidimicrobiales bacterium]